MGSGSPAPHAATAPRTESTLSQLTPSALKSSPSDSQNVSTRVASTYKHSKANVPARTTALTPNKQASSPTPSTPPTPISALHTARRTLSNPIFASFIAGGVAGAVSRTVVSPLERLKILFQIQSVGREEYKLSIGKALGKMWREEGFKGFMRGNGTNCVRIVPYSAVQFGSYNFYKRVSWSWRTRVMEAAHADWAVVCVFRSSADGSASSSNHRVRTSVNSLYEDYYAVVWPA